MAKRGNIFKRHKSRVTLTHAKMLNRIIYSYVFAVKDVSVFERWKIRREFDKQWASWCFTHRNNKFAPPLPGAFRSMIKNPKFIKAIQDDLQIGQLTVIESVLTFLGIL